MQKKNLIVIASPSGGGKSTITRYLIKKYPELTFSISATTRSRRENEKYGVQYYFLSVEDFQKKIQNDELVEYENFFGNYYGTLKSEINKSLLSGKKIIFDVDVKGALSLQKEYPDDTLLIFISPPSIQILEERLRKRNTENDEQILTRLLKAESEIAEKDKFDYVIVNEVLERAFKEMDELLFRFVF